MLETEDQKVLDKNNGEKIYFFKKEPHEISRYLDLKTRKRRIFPFPERKNRLSTMKTE